MRKLIALLMLVSSAGCNQWAFIKPTTTFAFSPYTKTLRMTNTKDVDSKIDGVDIGWSTTQPATGETITSGWARINKWDLVDSSSSVIRENVFQMKEATEQMKQTVAMLQSVGDSLAKVASVLTPGGLAPILSAGQASAASSSITGAIQSAIADAIAATVKDQVAKMAPGLIQKVIDQAKVTATAPASQ